MFTHLRLEQLVPRIFSYIPIHDFPKLKGNIFANLGLVWVLGLLDFPKKGSPSNNRFPLAGAQMPTKRGRGVGGGGPPTDRRQGRISRLPEGRLVNAAMVLLALTPALGLKVASSVSSSLTFDSEASLNSTQQVAQDLFKRVWMVCEEQKPQPRSAGEIAAGMAPLEPSKCTDEFSFQELCCADFKKLDFKRSGLMGLDNAKYLTTAPKQAKKVIKVCTSASNGMALMAQAKSDAASMPVECIKADFTEAQLRGESDGLQPGEIVLRERLLFFASQQIPISSIPTCGEAVKTCPGGKKPTIVQPAWLATKKGEAALFLQDKMDTDMTNFGGALMTSGSFTMMASGGAGL